MESTNHNKIYQNFPDRQQETSIIRLINKTVWGLPFTTSSIKEIPRNHDKPHSGTNSYKVKLFSLFSSRL